MTQTVVKKNLIKFLEIFSAKYFASLEALKEKQMKENPQDANDIATRFNVLETEHNQYIKKFKQSLKKHGFCIGFCIVHGAMDIVGKLDWWESVLVAIANWDGDKDKLEKEINIPNADTTNKLPKFEAIFDRAINYVVTQHGVASKHYKDFVVTGTIQETILRPDAHLIDEKTQKKQSYFEVVDKEGKIRTIQKRAAIAGTFSKNDIHLLLDQTVVKNLFSDVL